MKIKSIIISNYKSLGEERNVLLLEDNITALIGKNDSGKSNILEALGNISFIHHINDDFFSKIDCQYKCNILCLCCSEDLCRCFISKTLARSIIYYIYYNIKLILSYSRKIKSFRIKLS